MIRALSLCALLPLSAGAQTRALGLAEAYQLALARSEQIAISGATYEETIAKASEILSGVMPHVSVIGTETFQHVPRGASGLFREPRREQGWIAAHQPLFSGFREFLAYRASKDLGRAAELGLERAKQKLYADVARAYLDLLAAQDGIRIRGALLDITRDRVKDIKEFRKVGRSRPSEQLAAESQVAQQFAQLESARAAEQVAQFRLGFLTGLEERVEPSFPAEAGAGVPLLETVLARARTRADVEARRAELSSAELGVKVVSREHWPTISADANWYFRRPPSFTADVKWDATITGSIPIWSGGEISARTRQRKARAIAGRAALSEAVRMAELEAKSAHQDLLSSVAVSAAIENAARLAADNARAQNEDYRLGQVTNLDVLGSLNTLQQTRLQQSEARIDAYWSRVRLEVAAGAPGDPLR